MSDQEKKQVYLICNAHLDPVWQWTEEEGISAAISTFYSAANLLERYDYVFCHGEVTLYKYIERFAPELFRRIQELVRQGRWRIMGGWYLQPDCNMPSGESIARQILMGRRYFTEKFGVAPQVAINFDPFGHSRGLVQIMRKCGQTGYMIGRPYASQLKLESEQFLWVGFDGSKLPVVRSEAYNTPLGSAAKVIRERAARQREEICCVLWGVGNHGGGPSAQDLEDIQQMQAEDKDFLYLHSYPEALFSAIQPRAEFDRSLRISMPGCYTSMSRVKQKHSQLEQALYLTEKLCSVAALKGLIEYPSEALYEAAEDLMNAEFHDILPGSCVKAGEENGLRWMEHGLKILTDCKSKAYFALCGTQSPAEPGEYPVVVFNPQPYARECEIECEFSLADQNWSNSVSRVSVYDEDGRLLPSQTVKEESTIHLDWRKKVVFCGRLKPLGITRFRIFTELTAPEEKSPADGPIVYDGGDKFVEIDRTTGLIKSCRLSGIECAPGAFQPFLFEDNPDPWGMGEAQQQRMGTNGRPFTLMQEPDGAFSGCTSVQVIEDGAVYLGVEAFFECGHSRVRLEYRIYKGSPAVDVICDAFFHEADRMLKLSLPIGRPKRLIGQTAYGAEELFADGRECVAQRYVAAGSGEELLAVFNRGVYGCSYEDGRLWLSLLRGCTYCAHPIEDRSIVPGDRYLKKIDQGEHRFEFRLTACREEELERLAQEFSAPPFACNVFPIGGAAAESFSVEIDNPNIVLTALKREEDGNRYVLRLFHGCAGTAEAGLRVGKALAALKFTSYEVKTLLYDGQMLDECGEMRI